MGTIEKQMEYQANEATKLLSALVAKMVDDGIEPAALVEALASALGTMMAAAPRDLANKIAATVYADILRHRAVAWAAIDTAASAVQ